MSDIFLAVCQLAGLRTRQQAAYLIMLMVATICHYYLSWIRRESCYLSSASFFWG